jgi:GNAT superfamily N-acetyltransferase
MAMNTIPVEVRHSTLADAAAIAEVSRSAWSFAYRGIIPALDLEAIVRRRTATWWQEAQQKDGPALLLSFDNTVAGYSSFGRARSRRFPRHGEIYELYLRPEYHGMGLGRRLFDATRQELRQRGHKGLVVWSLSENMMARAFYEALGGRVAATELTRVGRSTLAITAYRWR